MTPHASKYEPTERIRWLCDGYAVLAQAPYTNRDRLAAIEQKIGAIVAEEFVSMLADFDEARGTQ